MQDMTVVGLMPFVYLCNNKACGNILGIKYEFNFYLQLSFETMLTNKWFINHTWDVCTNTYRLLCKVPLFWSNCNKTYKLHEILSTFPTLLILSLHLMYHTLIHLSLYTVCPKSSCTLRLKYRYWANYKGSP